jgi:hypothetical protein
MDEERIALRFEDSGLRGSQGTKLFEKRFPQPKLVRLQCHDSLELNICRRIRGRARADGKCVVLGTDPVLALSPRALHSYAIEACSGSMLVPRLSFRAPEPWLDPRALAERPSALPACFPAYRAAACALRLTAHIGSSGALHLTGLTGRLPRMGHPSAGQHYPRSFGEFQAWFRTDADCLGRYARWVLM